MKDENNVIETKTEKENKMSDTTKKREKESNVILSKLSEEQFNSVGNNPSQSYYGSLRFDGFYPTLNTELLTKVKNSGQMTKFEFLTEDELISIVKDYGSVSHSVVVNGEINYYSTDLSEYLNFDISAEKIEEIGVDEIKKWGEGGYGFERVEENFKSHSIYDESLEDYVINDSDFNPADSNDFYVSGVRVITTVKVVLPTQEKVVAQS